MTRYFLDTEFIDDGKTIDLISIGIVCEDGREYYAQSCEFDHHKASDWVQEHVFPSLNVCHHVTRADFNGTPKMAPILRAHKKGQCIDIGLDIRYVSTCLWRTRAQICNEITAFLDPEHYGVPEFWGWCAGYDWVALCQLFGTMMDIPSGWPHYIRDLQYLLDEWGIADDQLPAQEERLHNALADARHIASLWKWGEEQSSDKRASTLLSRPLNPRLMIERE